MFNITIKAEYDEWLYTYVRCLKYAVEYLKTISHATEKSEHLER